VDNLENLEKEIEIGLKTIKKAGDILLNGRKNNLIIKLKSDNSLVTDIDKESSDFIYSELKKNFPDYGIVDEERIYSNDSIDERIGKKYFWVVDPLDGTIDYVNRGKNYGVMIGLVKDNEPILGLIYRPEKNELIYASKNGGIFPNYCVNSSRKKWVLVSYHRNDPILDELLKIIKPGNIKKMSTSFKILEIAKGNYELFISTPKNKWNIWDLCAQDVILNEAGGKITDIYGGKIQYRSDIVLKNGIIASNGINHDLYVNAFKKIDK
jgi:3'-phosphoadenosine 5'-phosphosulfate (PAPS) 3'-phosphatase